MNMLEEAQALIAPELCERLILISAPQHAGQLLIVAPKVAHLDLIAN
jgi:hypothetical protein